MNPKLFSIHLHRCRSRQFFAITLLLILLLNSAIPAPQQQAFAAPEVPMTDPEWIVVDSMSTLRAYHTLSLLPNGKAMAIGGYYNDGSDHYLRSTEAFDPMNNQWTNLASMSVYRRHHTATVLLDGRVLVVGGQYFAQAYNSAEVYNPKTNSWVNASGTMSVQRYEHTASRLTDGRVLIVGGCSNTTTCTSTAEVFDPNTLTFSSAGSLSSGARQGHVAVLLQNGKVLVAGGYNPGAGGGTYRSSAEIYDPATNSWTTAANMGKARLDAAATLLPDGKVLVVGGFRSTIIGDETLASAEIYDPVANSWSDTGPMTLARRDHGQVMLYNGLVYAIGGHTGSFYTLDAEAYNVSSGGWSPIASLDRARSQFAAIQFASGAILIAGGWNGTEYFALAEVYNPQPTAVADTAAYSYVGFGAVPLPNGDILVAGGRTITPPYSFIYSTKIWRASTHLYESADNMNYRRSNFTLTLLNDGRVLATGGYYHWEIIGGYSATKTAEIYDPAQNTWTQLADTLAVERTDHLATLLTDGRVLLVDQGSQSEIFDPATNQFTLTAENPPIEEPHTATLLPGGEVLVVGGDAGANCAIYNPATDDWYAVASLPIHISGHSATLLPNGEVLVVGGSGGAIEPYTVMSTTHRYNRSLNTWTAASALNEARAWHSAILLPDGRVLAAGGSNDSESLLSVEIYDPLLNDWALVTPLTGATRGQVLLTPDGKVFLIQGAQLYSVYTDFSHPPSLNFILSSYVGSTWNFILAGADFLGSGASSSGETQNAATNQPLVQVRNIENGQIAWLYPDGAVSETYFKALPLINFPSGPLMITIFTNGGIASKIVTQAPPMQTFLPMLRR